jgi:hypothetical protein
MRLAAPAILGGYFRKGWIVNFCIGLALFGVVIVPSLQLILGRPQLLFSDHN